MCYQRRSQCTANGSTCIRNLLDIIILVCKLSRKLARKDVKSVLVHPLISLSSILLLVFILFILDVHPLKKNSGFAPVCYSLMKVHKTELMMLFYYGGLGYNALSPSLFSCIFTISFLCTISQLLRHEFSF